MSKLHNKKGFTLIELLVVIVIISVLATVAAVALNNARLKVRDAKRVADIKTLQTALEQYSNDEGIYPAAITPGSALVGPTSGVTYLKSVPSNPTPRTDGDCANSEYSYTQLSSGANWSLLYCLGSTVDGHVAGQYRVNSSSFWNNWFLCGTPITYSGQSYDTVEIGTQCWTADHLNVGTVVSRTGNQGTSCSAIEKYCYNDSDANCTTYGGGLYQWAQAMCGSTTAGAQGICPTGWHIPTDAEFKTLELAIGMSQAAVDSIGFRETNEGTKLKVGGSSGFEAVLTGYRHTDTNIYNSGTRIRIWSSTQSDPNAWMRDLLSGRAPDTVLRDIVPKAEGNVVRCLKD